VYVAELFQRIDHLQPNLNDPDAYAGLPGTHAITPLPCPYCSDSSAPIIAQPRGVAIDCRSNLYLLAGTGALVKFFDETPPPSPQCVKLSKILEVNPLTVLRRFILKGGGKSMALSLRLGCAFHDCIGKLTALSAGRLCRHCALTRSKHFRLAAGTQQTLSLSLTRTGRLVLAKHPGLLFQVFGKLGRKRHHMLLKAHLREPAMLTARCLAPGAAGADAQVSGALLPAVQHHAKIVLDYLSLPPSNALPTMVRRTVRADRRGHYSDRFSLAAAGKWVITAHWDGSRARQPAGATPCDLTVQKAQPHLTLVCPTAGSVGAPRNVSGVLAGGPVGGPIAVVYLSPSRSTIAHTVSAGADGTYSDAITPNEAGTWEALARYPGDGTHASAISIPCRFAVSRSPSALSLSCSATSDAKSINCSGSLSSSGLPIAGAQVMVSYQDPAGNVTVHSTTTLTDGTYADQLSAAVGTLLSPGIWHVQAAFAGDGAHGPASTSQDVTVP
jgi:hypothetical protein